MVPVVGESSQTSSQEHATGNGMQATRHGAGWRLRRLNPVGLHNNSQAKGCAGRLQLGPRDPIPCGYVGDKQLPAVRRKLKPEHCIWTLNTSKTRI